MPWFKHDLFTTFSYKVDLCLALDAYETVLATRGGLTDSIHCHLYKVPYNQQTFINKMCGLSSERFRVSYKYLFMIDISAALINNIIMYQIYKALFS